MKEFDLEAAKRGAPVCTRGGRKARIICFDAKNRDFPLVVLLDGFEEDGWNEDVHFYSKDGHYQVFGDDRSFDLMMDYVKKEGWMNIYKWEDTRRGSCVYNTEKEARDVANQLNDYIATIKIKWEE